MVATRRGLQVSKQKHNGVSFVNSFPRTSNPSIVSTPDLSKPLQRRFKFVTKHKEPRVKGSRSKTRDSDSSESGRTEKKPRRHSVKKEPQQTGSIVFYSFGNSSPSSTSSPDRDSEPDITKSISPTLETVPVQDFYDLGPGTSSFASPSPPVWSSHPLPSYLSVNDRKLFDLYLPLIPTEMYPFEQLLTYNPARSRDFYYTVVNDLAAIHCVLMWGTMYESVSKGERNSQELALHISKVCSIINRKLDQTPKRIEPITLECIATLALMGVSSEGVGKKDGPKSADTRAIELHRAL